MPKDDPVLLPARLAGWKTELEMLEQQALGPTDILDPSNMGLYGDQSTHDFDELNHQITSAEKLVGFAEGVVPYSTLAIESMSLHYWDISDRNVLVDPTTGTPTALLDWEQLYTLPDRLGSSPIIFEPKPFYMGNSVKKRPSMTSSGDADDFSACMDIWEFKKMKTAYWRRLRELKGLEEGNDAPGAFEEAPLANRIVEFEGSKWYIYPHEVKPLVDEHESASAVPSSPK